jgi:hypothetical protein
VPVADRSDEELGKRINPLARADRGPQLREARYQWTASLIIPRDLHEPSAQIVRISYAQDLADKLARDCPHICGHKPDSVTLNFQK